MLNVIFVTFYEKYRQNALKEILLIIKKLDCDTRLIIVDNSENLKSREFISHPLLENSKIEVSYVSGSNTAWEFSGWEEGLNTLIPLSSDDYYIFANDTFCHHRDWDCVNRALFVSAFKIHTSRGLKGITGDVNSKNLEFTLYGVKFDSWVSTYLFGIDGEQLKLCKNTIQIAPKKIEQLISINKKGNYLWSCENEICNNLQCHIEAWLSPKNSGWYKSKVENYFLKEMKTKAIINEKYLSTQVQFTGGRLNHYIPSIYLCFFRIYKKIKKIMKL